MSETSWENDDIDPATREAIEAAAAEAGVSVEDYVADRLLLSLLVDAREERAVEAVEAPPAPRPRQRESFALSHRLETVERRLGQTASGTDEAIAAFDASIVALGARLDESGAWADENAEAVDTALTELRAAIDALDGKANATNAILDALTRAHDSLRAQVLDDGAFYDQRLSVLEEVARSAEAAGVELAHSQDHLKRAIASDFIAYALDTDQKLAAQAEEICAAFDETHERMDTVAREAVEAEDRILADLLAAADTLSQRLREHAARIDGRIEAAEQASVRLEHQVSDARTLASAGIDRVEADASVALDRVRAALSAELERIGGAFGAALERTHEDFYAEFAQLSGRQQDAAAMLALLDTGLAKAGANLVAHREAVDARFADATARGEDRLARVRTDLSERISHVSADLEAADERARHAHKIASDEIIRVESCTLVALEAGAQARKSDYEALKQDLQHSHDALTAALEHTQRRLGAELTDLRDQTRGAMARLNQADDGLAACGRVIDAASVQVSTLNTRMDRVEARIASGDGQVGETLAAFGARLGVVELDAHELKQDDIVGRLQEIQALLAAHRAETNEAAERLGYLSGIVGRLSTQGAAGEMQASGRLHSLEVAVADLRLQQIAAPAEAGGSEDVAALRGDMAEAFEELHLRMLGLEQDTTAQDFEALRQRLEERHLALEAKTVRALDQLSRTVALLSRKFALEPPEERPEGDIAQSA